MCKFRIVGIKPLKARYDVTKIEFIIPLLSILYIDIYLSIQLISLALCITIGSWI